MKTLRQVTGRVLAAGLIVLGLGAMKQAYAVNNPDTMTVSVTPSVTYGVSISSVNGSGYQFQTVALGATTVSTKAITLTNTGNVSEYFSMAISNTSGSWSAVTAGAPGQDQFRLTAELAANQPVEGSGFKTGTAPGGDSLANPPVPATASGLYANGGSQSKTAAAGTSNLWLQLEMPTSLNAGGSGLQTMTLTVNGQGS